MSPTNTTYNDLAARAMMQGMIDGLLRRMGKRKQGTNRTPSRATIKARRKKGRR